MNREVHHGNCGFGRGVSRSSRSRVAGRALRVRYARSAVLAAVALAAVVPAAAAGPAGVSAAEIEPTDVGAASLAALAGTDGPAHTDAAAGLSTTAFQAISPVRVVDTRAGLGAARLSAGAEVTVDVLTARVLGAAGVARGDVAAVSLNITAVDASAAGYVSVWPAGVARPDVSSLNPTGPGATLANLVTAPVGADGRVSVFSFAATHLIVDVQGVFVRVTESAEGRFVPLPAARVLDTRASGVPLQPGETRTVALGGVPADAAGAVVNVTVTGATGPGFVTVWPAGVRMPEASNVNVSSVGATVANQVFAATRNGRVQVFSSGGGHVLVDVVGYFTGPSAPVGSDGLFVPVTPARVLDTRSDSVTAGSMVGAGSSVTTAPGGRAAVPISGVAAVALNVTVNDADAAGFVTAWPAATPRPNTSVVNADRAGHTVANHVVTRVSDAGVALFVSARTHLLVDVTGYFTGPPVSRDTTPPVADPPPVVPPSGEPPTIGPFAFIVDRPGGPPRWDPCSTIEYKVNGAAASAAQLAGMDAAIVQIEAATGLDLVSVGSTSGGLELEGVAGAEAVIAFAAPGQSARLDSSGAAGLGGFSYRDDEIVRGRVLVDTSVDDANDMLNLYLHELAHMIGLAHVDTQSQVMYGTLVGHNQFQSGDLAGLWHLGAAQGCLPQAATLTESQPALVTVVEPGH